MPLKAQEELKKLKAQSTKTAIVFTNVSSLYILCLLGGMYILTSRTISHHLSLIHSAIWCRHFHLLSPPFCSYKSMPVLIQNTQISHQLQQNDSVNDLANLQFEIKLATGSYLFTNQWLKQRVRWLVSIKDHVLPSISKINLQQQDKYKLPVPKFIGWWSMNIVPPHFPINYWTKNIM